MKSSTAMMADISELTDTPKTWTNCIAVNNNEDYRERGFAKNTPDWYVEAQSHMELCSG